MRAFVDAKLDLFAADARRKPDRKVPAAVRVATLCATERCQGRVVTLGDTPWDIFDEDALTDAKRPGVAVFEMAGRDVHCEDCTDRVWSADQLGADGYIIDGAKMSRTDGTPDGEFTKVRYPGEESGSGESPSGSDRSPEDRPVRYGESERDGGESGDLNESDQNRHPTPNMGEAAKRLQILNLNCKDVNNSNSPDKTIKRSSGSSTISSSLGTSQPQVDDPGSQNVRPDAGQIEENSGDESDHLIFPRLDPLGDSEISFDPSDESLQIEPDSDSIEEVENTEAETDGQAEAVKATAEPLKSIEDYTETFYDAPERESPENPQQKSTTPGEMGDEDGETDADSEKEPWEEDFEWPADMSTCHLM
jgi:hypothetical protein